MVKAWLVNAVSDTPGKVLRPKITPTKAGKVSVRGNVAVAAVDRGAIIRFSVNNNVGLVVTSAGEEVCPLFTLIIGGAEIGVAIAGVNFEAAKLVNQPDINYASDCVTAINRGSAVLQNVDVINQPNGKYVEVECTTEKRIEADIKPGKTVRRETTSILQHEGFFGSKTAQVDLRLATADGVYIFIDRRSSSHGQLLNKVSGTAHAESFDVGLAIGIDGLWPNFFRGSDVCAGHNNL